MQPYLQPRFAAPVPAVDGIEPPRFSPTSMKVIVGRIVPLALVLTGLIIFAFPTNFVFMLGTAMASVLTLLTTYLIIFSSRELRLSWVMADGLMLGYAVGTFNTGVRLILTGSSLTEQFARTQQQFSTAMAVAIWVSSVLFIFGTLEIPLRIDLKRFRNFDFFYVLLGMLIVVAAFATGGIGYMGVAADNDEHHVTAIGEMAGMLGPVLPALTVLLRKRCRILHSNLIFWGLIAIQIMFLVPQGRRFIIYATTLAVLAFTLQGASWRGSIIKKVLLLAVAGVVLYSANVFFFAMRHAKGQTKDKHMGLMANVSNAWEFLTSDHNEQFDSEVSENLRDRTFVLRYYSDVLNASWTHQPLYGGDFLFCVKFALPSALYPDKQKTLDIGMEEALIAPDFGLWATDEANSILTTGIADFGVAGAFAYPLLLVLAMNIYARALTSRSPAILQALIVLCVVYPMFQVEIAGEGCLIRARDLLILTICLLPVEMLLSLSQRRRGFRTRKPVLAPAR